MLDVYKMNDNLTRQYKHTLGESLRNELKDLIVTIYRANSNDEEKEQNLRRARESVVAVRLYLRMLHDLGQINLKCFVALGDKVEGLSKQIVAWHRSTLSKHKAGSECP